MNDSRIVLGIDGGGTKTTAWIAAIDQHDSLRPHIVGRGTGGPSNAVAVRFEIAVQSVNDAIKQATHEAQIDLKQVATLCLAIAGADRETVFQSWKQWIGSLGVDNFLVTNDVAAVFAAGCEYGIGVALISGTGSIAFGRNTQNECVRVGGWGPSISDEGSGYWIARQALKAIVRAEDQLACKTNLKKKFLEELQVGSVFELVREINRFDKRAWANWSSLVFQAAEEDSVADEILDKAISYLSESVREVANQLRLGSEFPVALSGGILTYNKTFRTKLMSTWAQAGLRLRHSLVEEPVRGAIVLAAQHTDS